MRADDDNPEAALIQQRDKTGEGCPQCGGEGRQLGELGANVWRRCRQCGWEWSERAAPEERGQ